MKREELISYIAIGIVVIGIIILVLFKFVIVKKHADSFAFKDFDKITVTDLNGNENKLTDLVSKDGSTYCFIFDLSDCYSCIYKGIQDMKVLKKAGKLCICLVVHHNVDEVRGWTTNHDFSPFFVLNKVDFYEHVHTQMLPVIVQIRSKEVENAKYITIGQ
jgi:hypothetical protein